jgi:Protein of unknown function (DUF2950)
MSGGRQRATATIRSTDVKSPSTTASRSRAVLLALACACFSFASLAGAQQTAPAAAPAAPATVAPAAESFDSPKQAADAMVEAADRFDTTALTRILGAGHMDVVLTENAADDRQRAKAFAARAHEKMSVQIDPKDAGRAVLFVGNQDWPFAVPIVKRHGKWSFDAVAGREELLNRRIGANELDAIAICHGYVEAQYEYAYQPREGYAAHEYAQRIISTPGKRDGLAWQNADGTWGGPVGAKIAHAIQQGYTSKAEPYHGYFFKVLKRQGPSAPRGSMDYVVKGVMIGGFALVAAPAEYGETGIMTFMVSQTGTVYQKDLGPGTAQAFRTMQQFNPDKTWFPVEE